MSLRYLGDLIEGAEGVSVRRTVTEADIMAFCGASGDCNPRHPCELSQQGLTEREVGNVGGGGIAGKRHNDGRSEQAKPLRAPR